MPTPRVHADRAGRQRAYRARTKQALADQLLAKGLPSTAIIPTMPPTARWRGLREQALVALTAMSVEMAAYRNDRSEAWLESDQGEQFETLIEAVNEVVAAVGEIALE